MGESSGVPNPCSQWNCEGAGRGGGGGTEGAFGNLLATREVMLPRVRKKHQVISPTGANSAFALYNRLK